MDFVIFMTLPGLVIVLIALAAADRLLQRLGRAGGLPWQRSAGHAGISAIAFEELEAGLGAGGKQHELKERQSALMLRDEEDDGAPPHRTTVDLDGGIAVVRVPKQAP
ncbi:hypothetical protein G4Z16_08805 [Streptomyces bathyalis]|uniref:Uncharacterized protein n=1 Tax=Streptomyces bathyalis TaxID=2710756 RepID=A0A7T1T4Y5_9ACTN|nr:DUF6191 domain-containing protein [Streptomyces bathyalis]QPP06481.1 hypothetical protein G4Z16_08805 [Streptomyces bathyalis]